MNKQDNNKKKLFEMMNKVGGMPIRDVDNKDKNINEAYNKWGTNKDINRPKEKYVNIAWRRYKDKMEEFWKSADEFLTNAKYNRRDYRFHNKYGYIGLYVLELGKYDLKVASELMGAMWVCNDIDGYGESVIANAMGKYGDRNKQKAMREIREVWGINVSEYENFY